MTNIRYAVTYKDFCASVVVCMELMSIDFISEWLIQLSNKIFNILTIPSTGLGKYAKK